MATPQMPIPTIMIDPGEATDQVRCGYLNIHEILVHILKLFYQTILEIDLCGSIVTVD